jgi:hypothetical protein
MTTSLSRVSTERCWRMKLWILMTMMMSEKMNWWMKNRTFANSGKMKRRIRKTKQKKRRRRKRNLTDRRSSTAMSSTIAKM